MISIIFNRNVREKIYEGMKKTTEIVAKTLGPNGKNIVIDNFGIHISSDGLKVAKSVFFDNKLMNIGATLLVRASELTKEKCGDGTTSTIILSHELIKNIQTFDYSNINLVNQGIKLANDQINKLLDELAFEVKTKEKIYDCAMTSSNNREIANVISDAVIQMGEYGAILTMPTYEERIHLRVYEGIVLNSGYISSFLATNNSLVLINPYVILVNDNINTISELENILYDIKKNKRDLLIIALSFSKDVIDHMIYLQKNDNYKICGCLAPEFGDKRKEVLEDLALYLNTYIITNKTIFITPETIGKANRIDITKNMTIIKKNHDNNNTIDKRIQYLKKEYELKGDNFYLKRLAYLSKGIAYVMIPMQNEYNYEIIKEKVDNAISSAYNSFRNKACLGGGMTLNEVSNKLSFDDITDDVIKNTFIAIKNSLKIIRQTIGEDEIKDNILDSLHNTKVIIQNSLSLLSLFISIDGAIINKENAKFDELSF